MRFTWTPFVVPLVAVLVSGCFQHYAPPVAYQSPSHTTPAAALPQQTVPAPGAPSQSLPAPTTTSFVQRSSATTCTEASAWLPLANAGSIGTPSHLAALVEQSLGLDPSGNGLVSGTNMSPNMYLVSVNRAKHRVSGVGALPVYLRSLIQVDLPRDVSYLMTRVK